MTRRFCSLSFVLALIASTAPAEEFQLVTGVAPGTSPGAGRLVFPAVGVPGAFVDGQRLGGTPSAAPTAYSGTGTPLFSTNQFGSLSFMFRRGSVPIPGIGQQPVLAVDYLGGPLLDLDGDLNNGSRRLTPLAGQSPVAIPGSRGLIDLSFNPGGGTVALNRFDATANNSGFQGFGPQIAVTVNTLAGTQSNGTPGAAINPAADTRLGTLTASGAGITRIDNLGYELWQDAIDPTSSTASTLGTFQYLGSMRGWRIERDASGDFPLLAGQLGTTLWPFVNASTVGQVLNTSGGPAGPTATITGGPANDPFTAPNNGGLPLTSFSDLGAYLDAVVVPAIDPLSASFVYLDAAGFGINNSFDPVFGDSAGYDAVIVAQSAPVPEPASGILFIAAGLAALRRPRGKG